MTIAGKVEKIIPPENRAVICILLVVSSLIGLGVGTCLWWWLGYEAILVLPTSQPSHGMQFSQDGSRLVSIEYDVLGERMVVWNLRNGRPTLLREGKPGFVPWFAFSPDGKYIAGTLMTEVQNESDPWWTVIVWDCDTGEEKTSFRGYYKPLCYKGILCAIANPQQRLVSLENKKVLLDLIDEELSYLECDGKFLLVGHFSPKTHLTDFDTGRRTALAGDVFRVFDPEDGKLLSELPCLELNNEVFISENGKCAAFTTTSNPTLPPHPAWVSSDGKKKAFPGPAHCDGISPDGKTIIVGSNQDDLKMVDVASGDTIWSWSLGRIARFSPDGKIIAVESSYSDIWGDHNSIRLYELPPRRPWFRIIAIAFFAGLIIFCSGHYFILKNR